MKEPQIGDRQKVSRVKHPAFGEGRAVYQNGPAFFVADSGLVVHFDKIDAGGASQTRSWLVARVDGTRVELEKIGRDHGKTHDRVVAEDGRAGWLVWWFDEFGTWCNVFEPDDGSEPLKFGATFAYVGHPKDRKKAKLPAERAHFMTVGRKGFEFVYSREGDTPAVAAKRQSEQLDLLRGLAKKEGATP